MGEERERNVGFGLSEAMKKEERLKIREGKDL